MYLDVPGEILAQIASFLSKKDCNSLMRTSKTAYNKLDSFQNLLPKAKLDLEIHWNIGNIVFLAKTIHTRWRVEFFILQHNELITDEAEARDMLLKFFKEQTESGTSGNIIIPYVDALALYLNFIFFHFQIESLKLNEFVESDCEKIIRYMKVNRCNLKHLHIETEYLPPNTLELIRICEPNVLVINGTQLPEGFFQAPVIKHLPSLCVTTYHRGMSDHELLSLRAEHICHHFETDITIQGLLSFVSEWIDAKRKIKSVRLKMSWMITVDEWKTKLSELSQDLVNITITKEETSTISADLRRSSDGLVVTCTKSRKEISLEIV